MDIQVLWMLLACLLIVSTEFGTVERPWFLEVGGAVILRYSDFRTLPNSWPWMQNSERDCAPYLLFFNTPYILYTSYELSHIHAISRWWVLCHYDLIFIPSIIAPADFNL
jgi:hypothetical protein